METLTAKAESCEDAKKLVNLKLDIKKKEGMHLVGVVHSFYINHEWLAFASVVDPRLSSNITGKY